MAASLQITALSPAPAEYVIVEAVPQQPAGRAQPPNTWQVLYVGDGPSIPINVYGQFIARFGRLRPGYRVWLRLTYASPFGFTSAPFLVSTLVS